MVNVRQFCKYETKVVNMRQNDDKLVNMRQNGKYETKRQTPVVNMRQNGKHWGWGLEK